MTLITDRMELNKHFRQTLSSRYNDCEIFPQTFKFTPDDGLTIYTITIEKSEPTFFIDSKGRKWRREE